MGKSQKGFTAVTLMVLLFSVACLYGWFANIVKIVQFALTNVDIAHVTLLFIARVIGIFFPPLGAVLGFF